MNLSSPKIVMTNPSTKAPKYDRVGVDDAAHLHFHDVHDMFQVFLLHGTGFMDGRENDEQLSLDLGPPPRDCLFFAVVPPAAVAAHIVERAQKVATSARRAFTPASSGIAPHSMNGIGIYRGLQKKVVHAAVEAGSQVEMAPFEVTFDHAMGFKNRSLSPFVLCARVDPSGLLELRSAIGTAMHSVGFRDTGRARFKPHVTMMYTDQMMCEACVDEPIRWTVHDFVLVYSLQGRGRHVYCRRWPLHC